MIKTKEEIDKLVTENINLVHMVINRNFKNHVKTYKDLDIYEDAFQIGSIGLYTAANKFDKSKGFKFSTYAAKCITMEILKFNDRYVKKNYLAGVLSLNLTTGIGDEKEIELQETLADHEQGYEDLEINETMHKLQQHLTEREERVLELKLKGMTQTEIGSRIGFSQVHVSRVLAKIKNKIIAIEENNTSHLEAI